MPTLSGRQFFFGTNNHLAPGPRTIKQGGIVKYLLDRMGDHERFTILRALGEGPGVVHTAGDSVTTSLRYLSSGRWSSRARVDDGVRMADRIFETRHAAGARLPIHRHRTGYVAVIIDGGYYEASVDGLWWCEAGSLIVHPPFHAHANWFPNGAARVLNVSLARGWADTIGQRYGAWKLPRGVAWSRMARVRPHDLLSALAEAESIAAVAAPEAIARVAERMRSSSAASVAASSHEVRLTREHVSRTFRRYFGVPPSVYRAEHRLREAVRLIIETGLPLSRIAQQAGFADQPHLTRAVKAATGTPPKEMRSHATAV